MNGLQYALDLIDKSFGTGIRKAKKQTEGLDSAVGKANDNLANISVVGRKSTNRLSGALGGLKNKIAAVFAVGAIMSFGNQVTKVGAEFEGMENAIEFASGQRGAENIQFLDDTINQLNLDMRSSYKGFQTLTGSMKGTALEGKATRDIFEGVGIAASVMNLSAEQSEGAFLALSQMASKGKVQAEELRGQLGERIPGALGIAARAMGVNQKEFNKMLDSGQVYAEDFLPKFAKELKNTFQDGLPAAANSMQAAINKKNNALISLKKAVADSLQPEIKAFLTTGSGMLNWFKELIPQLEPVKVAFLNLITAFEPIIIAFQNAGASAGGTSGIIATFATVLNWTATIAGVFAEGLGFMIENFKIFLPIIGSAILAQKIYAFTQIAAASNMSILTLATQGLNAAMKANPIGFAIGLIIALVGAIKYAWNNLGWFRGAVMASWEAIKGFAIAIKDYVITRFKEILTGVTGIGKAIKLFFKGDWDGAWEAGKKATKNLMGGDSKKQLIDDLKETGKKAGEAYNKGVKEVEMENAEKKNKSVVPEPDQAYKKFFPDDKEKNNTEIETQKPSTQVAGGGGSSSKKTTFNIQSFVKNLHIHTQAIKDSPEELRQQLTQIFGEVMEDLMTRADA